MDRRFTPLYDDIMKLPNGRYDGATALVFKVVLCHLLRLGDAIQKGLDVDCSIAGLSRYTGLSRRRVRRYVSVIGTIRPGGVDTLSQSDMVTLSHSLGRFDHNTRSHRPDKRQRERERRSGRFIKTDKDPSLNTSQLASYGKSPIATVSQDLDIINRYGKTTDDLDGRLSCLICRTDCRPSLHQPGSKLRPATDDDRRPTSDSLPRLTKDESRRITSSGGVVRLSQIITEDKS